MDPIHIIVLITLSFAPGEPDQHIRGAIVQPSFTNMSDCEAARTSEKFDDFIQQALDDLHEKTNYIKASVTSQCVDVTEKDKS